MIVVPGKLMAQAGRVPYSKLAASRLAMADRIMVFFKAAATRSSLGVVPVPRLVRSKLNQKNRNQINS